MEEFKIIVKFLYKLMSVNRNVFLFSTEHPIGMMIKQSNDIE